MKILLLAPGTWSHTIRTVDCLLESGHQVILMDGQSLDPYPQGRSGYQFIRYPRMGLRYYKRLLGSRLASKLQLWLAAPQLRLLWQYHKPDVTHVCWVDYRAYHCLRSGLKPLVLSVWAEEVDASLMPGADQHRNEMIRQTLTAADLTIVDAPNTSERCALFTGKEIETEFLHLGVDTKIFRPGYREEAMEWRRRLQIPEAAKVFMSMRRIWPNYNHHLILDAFARSLPDIQTDVFLIFRLFVNHDGQCLTELRHRAERLGVAEWVRWIEEVPVERLPELYALADVILNYPSLDTFPITFMEAAACERLVITCRLPSYLNIFAEKYFRMVQPENVGDLARAMTEFVHQPPSEMERQRLSLSEARREVVSKYDATVYARGLTSIYKKVVGRNASSTRD